MEKDREWKEKYNLLDKETNDEIGRLKRQVETVEDERHQVRVKYEAQIKVMTEHMAEMSLQND